MAFLDAVDTPPRPESWNLASENGFARDCPLYRRVSQKFVYRWPASSVIGQLGWGVGGETDAATHAQIIASPGRTPQAVGQSRPGWTSEGCYGEDRHNPSRRGYIFREFAMHIIWTIIIGFIAGVIAKFVTPGGNEPSGFILTTILGVVGAFLATYLGQAIGWYRADEGAGLIGAVVGAIIILVIWGIIDRRRRPSP